MQHTKGVWKTVRNPWGKKETPAVRNTGLNLEKREYIPGNKENKDKERNTPGPEKVKIYTGNKKEVVIIYKGKI